MNTLDWIISAVGAGSVLAVGLWGWYNSKKADALESALAVMRAAAQEWRQAEQVRRDQLRKVVADAAVRIAREAQEDERTAEAAGTDPAAAAGLLNGLHDGGPGPGDPPAGGVPTPAPPTVS